MKKHQNQCYQQRRTFRGRGIVGNQNYQDQSILNGKRKPIKYVGSGFDETNDRTTTTTSTRFDSNHGTSDLCQSATFFVNASENLHGSVQRANDQIIDIATSTMRCKHAITDHQDDDNILFHDQQAQQQENQQTEDGDSCHNKGSDSGRITFTDQSSWDRDMQHIRSKIRNVQRSIQNSSSATLSQPIVYETNVLNAVYNCCKSWSSILRYHLHTSKSSFFDNDCTTIQTEAGTESLKVGAFFLAATKIANELFGLIQLSVQCGPLGGSKPAYFKRCGDRIRLMVQDYLRTILQHFEIQFMIHNAGLKIKTCDEVLNNTEREVTTDTTGSNNDEITYSGASNTCQSDNNCSKYPSNDEVFHIVDSPHINHDDAMLKSIDDATDVDSNSVDDCDDDEEDDSSLIACTTRRSAIDDQADDNIRTCTDSNLANDDLLLLVMPSNTHYSTNDTSTDDKVRCSATLYFTNKQVHAIESWYMCSFKMMWKKNDSKNHKEGNNDSDDNNSDKIEMPSKYIQKKQLNGLTNTCKKKLTRLKKKERRLLKKTTDAP